jgi:Asp/Glu/hydantoin racemase
MESIVAIIHATRNAIQPINEVFVPQLEEIEILNFLDEAMLWVTQKKGVSNPDVLRRMEAILLSAERAGAEMIVSSCTSLSPAIDHALQKISVPVLKIEVALAEEIVPRYQRVRAVVTSTTTIAPIKEIIAAYGEATGKTIELHFHYCEGAFRALSNNQPEIHDQIVLEAIHANASKKPDAIILPQVSIARIVSRLDDQVEVPVLSSVHLSVSRVRDFFEHRYSRAENSEEG